MHIKIRAPYFADVDPDGAGGAAAAPDIEALLSWNEEEKGPIPDDLKAIPVESVRSYVSERSTRVAAETEASVRQRLLDDQQQERGAQQTRAELEKEISWAEDLEKRRGAADAATREAANAEYTRNEERYVNALAGKHSMRQRVLSSQVLEQHFRPQFETLAAAGHEDFVKTKLPAMVKEHGGVLAATLAYGKSLGDAEGYARGVDEEGRKHRVENNANGAQASNDKGGGGAHDALAGIDRTKPGAGAAIARAALAAKRR